LHGSDLPGAMVLWVSRRIMVAGHNKIKSEHDEQINLWMTARREGGMRMLCSRVESEEMTWRRMYKKR
jgi:hypothetical protein